MPIGTFCMSGIVHLRNPAIVYRPAPHYLSTIFPLKFPAFFPLIKKIHSELCTVPELHLFLTSLLPFYMIEKVISDLTEIPFVLRYDCCVG